MECQSRKWKSSRICSHAIAVAEKEDALSVFLGWYEKQKPKKKRNFTSAANLNVNVSILGNKGSQPRRKRKPARAPTATIAGDRGRQTYTLKWLQESLAFKCYGCESAIREPGFLPDPPNDVIIATKEYRSFI